MSGAAGERLRAYLVSAAHRLGTTACLLLVAAVAAGELRTDKRYVLATAFTAAQLGCVCGYVGAVAGRGRAQGSDALAVAREARNVALFNFAVLLLAMGWMVVPRIVNRGH